MNMTRHASTRSQQRAIPQIMIDLLLQFGKSESSGAGFVKIFFDRQSRKRLASYAGPIASLLDEHMNLYVVIDKDMKIITVGHRLERIQRQ